MTKEMLDALVYALSTPSWVDILLLIVTAAYFIATVFVYWANKKMAKAAEDQIKTATQMAELSKNVGLYDKRMELIEHVNSNNVREICRSNDFRIKLAILFSSGEIMSEYDNLKDLDKQADICLSKEGVYIMNSKDLPIKYRSLSSQIEKVLEKTTEQEDLERVKKLACENIVVVSKGGNESEQLNLFELIERRKFLRELCENSKRKLIEIMSSFLENTISICS